MLKIGDVVAERFSVVRLAGTGGMGAVYLADDRVTGRPVAIKVLAGEGDGDDRFQREAGVLAELTHPAIVRYIDHRADDVSVRYLAMEWLEGEDLGDRLRRQPLSLAESLRLVRRVAEGLGAAHARGIVHRDIKPSNLFLVDRDVAKVKVLDFGIAQLSGAWNRLTRTGVAVGTPGYMAPEQARGDRDIDARTDVFALGCVLYECIAGRSPFAAAHAMAMLGRVLFDRPDPLASIAPDHPPPVQAFLDRILSKDRAERPRDGAELATEVRQVEGQMAGFVAQASAAPSPPTPSLTGNEQRIVSVVVAGTLPPSSDAPTAPWTPPDVASPSAPHLRRVAEAHGARPEQLADGSLVALLPGRSLPREQAARAARCALAMRKVWREGPLALVTGRAVVERVPVGDALDRAAQALDGAPFDTVRIDALTADLLDDRFDVRRDGKYFKLVGERAEPATDKLEQTAERTVLGRRTPFVGRQRELAMLQAAWETTMAGAGAAAIVVTAAPGVGKSRLSSEWLGRVHAAEPRRPCTILSARADVWGGEAPYSLLSATLRRWAGVDAESAADPRTLLEARLTDLVGAAQTAEILPVLTTVALGQSGEALLSMDAVSRGDQIRGAFGAWFGALVAAGPVAAVLEDMHLADAPSVAMIDDGLARFAERPFLVVALARPAVHERFERLWADRNLTHMRLASLPPGVSRALVRSTVGTEPADAEIDRLLQRAEGNPLFLEEMIRARAEGAADTLPTTVLGVLQTRFDALDAEARRVLRAASVFGDRWTVAGVSALMGEGVSPVSVLEWFRHLATWEIVLEKKHPTAEPIFTFRHDLLREAAYAMLTDADRKLGHRLAAGWLEAHEPSTAPLVLAEHFERGADADNARRRFLEAAEGALDANDFELAVAHAERAVAAGATGADLGRARLVQAEAHGWRGRYAEGHVAALAAADAVDLGSEAWFRAVSEIAYTGAPLGKRDEVVEWAQKLRDRMSGAADEESPGRARAICRVVVQSVLVGAYPLARDLLTQVRHSAESLAVDDPLVAARLHQARGFVAMIDGAVEEAFEQHGLATQRFREAASIRQAHFSALQECFSLLEMGRYGAVEELLDEALGAGERMGLLNTVPMMRILYAYALVRQGRPDAPAIDAQLARIPDEAGDLRADGITRANLALVLCARDDLEGAVRAAERALGAREAFPPLGGRALGMLSRVLLAGGRHVEALAAAEAGMEILDELGSVLCDESLLRHAHVEALAAAGRADEARVAARSARGRIEARAAAIRSDAWRAAFLAAPDNRGTLALCSEWAVAP